MELAQVKLMAWEVYRVLAHWLNTDVESVSEAAPLTDVGYNRLLCAVSFVLSTL